LVAIAFCVDAGVVTNGLVTWTPGVVPGAAGVPVNLIFAMAVAVWAIVTTFCVGSEKARVAVGPVDSVDAERRQPVKLDRTKTTRMIR
jgi:hypothetical protein